MILEIFLTSFVQKWKKIFPVLVEGGNKYFQFIAQSRLNRIEQVDALIEDLQPRELRGRVQYILESFLDDPHAKKLYLITVQPFWTPEAPVKRKLFSKD